MFCNLWAYMLLEMFSILFFAKSTLSIYPWRLEVTLLFGTSSSFGGGFSATSCAHSNENFIFYSIEIVYS